MHPSILLVSLLAAAMPPSVAVTPFRGDAPSADLARVVERVLVTDLSARHVSITVGDQASHHDSLQVQLTSCAENRARCNGDLARAFHVGSFLTGNLKRDVAGFHLTLTLLDANGRTTSERILDGASGWALVGAIHEAADALVAQIEKTTGAKLPDVSARRSLAPWVTSAGAATLLGGALFLGLAAHQAARLSDTSPSQLASIDEARASAEIGAADQRLGIVLAAVGAAATAVGVAMYVTSRPGSPPIRLSMGATASGGGLAISGTFE